MVRRVAITAGPAVYMGTVETWSYQFFAEKILEIEFLDKPFLRGNLFLTPTKFETIPPGLNCGWAVLKDQANVFTKGLSRGCHGLRVDKKFQWIF